MARKLRTDKERFMMCFEVDESGCWNWIRSLNHAGYGQFHIGSRVDHSRQMVRAHRYSYKIFVGQIPDGLTIDHLCKNRKCVNPNHLEAVDIRTNVLRGESFVAKNALKTHCPKNHEYSVDNLYLYRGKRICRKCHHASAIKNYLRKRAVRKPNRSRRMYLEGVVAI